MLARCCSDRTNHVAMLGCLLVGLCIRGRIHLGHQFLEQRCSIAVEGAAHRLDAVVVSGAVNARPSAQTDVHGEATLRKQFLAIANAKLTAKQLHHLFGCTCVGERAPLLGVFWRPSGVHDSGKFIVGHGQVREGFVVLQHGVESRHVLPNQLAFEHQSRLWCLGYDAFDVVGSSNEFRNHVAVGIGSKIRPNSFIEPCRLADIEHSALVCFEQIHARFMREVSRSQVHGHGLPTLALTQKGNPVALAEQRWGCLMKETHEHVLSFPC